MALAGKKPAADRPVIASCLIVDGRTTDPKQPVDVPQRRSFNVGVETGRAEVETGSLEERLMAQC